MLYLCIYEWNVVILVFENKMKRVYMNRLIKSLILGVLGIMTMSCGKEDIADEYFVRYVAVANGQSEVLINYTNEKNENVSVQSPANFVTHEYTVGPVTVGFEAKMEATYSESGDALELLMIEVSKNGGKYEKKQSGEKCPSIIYTIE